MNLFQQIWHTKCKLMNTGAHKTCKTCTSNSQTQTNAQTRRENCLGLPGTFCFWSSHGRYLRPLRFDILTAPVCVHVCERCERLHFIKHIPHSGLSLSSSTWNNSLFPDFVCLETSRPSFTPSPLCRWARVRKLIIDFIRQWSHGPLQAESQRLERTLPEWLHFIHNPPQSSCSQHRATGEPVWHTEDYCAMLSLDVNTQWPVKCSPTKLQQAAAAALTRGWSIRGVRRESERMSHFEHVTAVSHERFERITRP